VINLKAAKQIGLTLSPEFLSRADKVIKLNEVAPAAYAKKCTNIFQTHITAKHAYTAAVTVRA